MAQLRQDYTEFLERDAAVLVVGPEGKGAFARYWREHDLPFTGLPNPGGSVLKRFGQQVSLFKLGRMPAQVIVDKDGTVRYVHYGASMSDIPSNEELLEILDELQAEMPSWQETGSRA